MGFLCSDNEEKKIVSRVKQEEVITSRDLGLDNVYNVNTNINVCPEKFLSPEYYVTGATGNILLSCSGNTIECPPGYTLLINNTCEKITTTTATAPLSAVTINRYASYEPSNGAYILEGAVIHENITNKQWPLITTPQTSNGATNTFNTVIPLSGSANGVTYNTIYPTPLGGGQHQNCDLPQGPYPTTVPGWGLVPSRAYYNGDIRESVISGGTPTLYPGAGNVVEPVWFMTGSPWNTCYTGIGCNSGPLGVPSLSNWMNTVGVWSSTEPIQKWIGFSQCVTITTPKEYFIAFAANNAGRFSINGELVVEMNIGNGYRRTLTYANIFSITLSAGTYIFNVEALDYSAKGGMGFDIYDTDLATLTGVTSYAQLTGLTIFSTIDRYGSYFDVSSFSAYTYTCPSGYLYSNCNGNNCTKIETTGYTINTCTTSIPIQLTGCTTGSTNVYNLDYTPNFDFKFILTGNTEYTGYTGSLCYNIYNDVRFTSGKSTGVLSRGTETVSKCIPFSNLITSSTITESFVEGSLPKTWSQYMVRPYYGFTTKDCSKGLTFNTWDNVVQQNKFSEGDYYFVTVVDPEKPTLAPPQDQPIPNYNFVQDILLKNGVSGPQGPQAINGILNYFILKWRPVDISSVMIFVNGVKLTNNYDYTFINRGFTVPPIVQFNFELKPTDWVVANYMSGIADANLNTDFSKYFVNTLVVENITVDTNPGYNIALNYNTTTLKQEFYCTQPISKDDAIIVFINGIELVQNQQFFLSTSQDNRIIFNNIAPLVPGDVVSIFAVSPNFMFGSNDYGSLTEPTFKVQWSSVSSLPENVSGKFIVQIFDKDDISNTVLYEQQTPFVTDLVNYELTFNSLGLDLYYRFRVTFQTTYTTYLNNEITTCSYSEGYFDTVNEYINNTY